jgi:ABC-type glycerol-3-phosphate transport system permease component
MFPQIAIVTPRYPVLRKMYLLDTYRGLTGGHIGLARPLTVRVMWGHFRAILSHLPWGDVAAATVVVTIPLVVLVLIFQRRIVRGPTAGAVKG